MHRGKAALTTEMQEYALRFSGEAVQWHLGSIPNTESRQELLPRFNPGGALKEADCNSPKLEVHPHIRIDPATAIATHLWLLRVKTQVCQAICSSQHRFGHVCRVRIRSYLSTALQYGPLHHRGCGFVATCKDKTLEGFQGLDQPAASWRNPIDITKPQGWSVHRLGGHQKPTLPGAEFIPCTRFVAARASSMWLFFSRGSCFGSAQPFGHPASAM